MREKNLLPILMALTLISCKINDSEITVSNITGNYKIVSLESNTKVDLNNDGIKSNDIYLEISKPHITLDGQEISFYNFNLSQNFLEIRPLSYQNNNAKLITFNFPHQYIDYLSNGLVFLGEYSNVFRNYSYKLGQDEEILLINENPEFDKQFGELITLKQFGTNKLELKLVKKVFDFSELKWLEIELRAEYIKI